jgi:probable rRNA maturation factor
MIHVNIAEPYRSLVSASTFEKAARAALQQLSAGTDSGLSIILTDDNQLRRLNRQFLGIDAPTDVLSFPAGYTDPDSGTLYLGDVLISYPRAQKQAEAAGHAVDAELQLLVVHGVLHLLGHDHEDEEGKERMWSVQTEVLAQLQVQIHNPPQ